MAIAYASIQTATSGGSSDTSVTVTKPTSLAAGDLMVFSIAADNSTTTTLTGWTFVGNGTPGDNRRIAVYFKIASSADAAASDFTATLGTSRFWLGAIIRATGSAVDIQSLTGIDTATNSHSFATGITPGQASSLLIMVTGFRSGSFTGSTQAIATSNPTWTERNDAVNGAGQGCNLNIATAIRTESTSTGAWSLTSSSSTDSYSIIMSFGASIDESVTLDAVALTGTPKEPVIAGDANVTIGVVSMTSTPKDPTSTQVDGKWSNTSKNAATNVTNTTKN